MNKQIVSYISLLIIITINSCKTLDRSPTYTVKGKIVKDCDGEPIVGLQVRLQYRSVNLINSKREEIDIDTTDEEGNYEFTIPYKYDEGLNIMRGWGQSGEDIIGGVYINPPDKKEGGVYEYLIYYDEYTRLSVLKFTIDNTNYNANDTLYIGTSNIPKQIVHPIEKTAIVYFSNKIEGPYNIPTKNGSEYIEARLNWGIGWTDYLKSIHSPGKEAYHYLHYKTYICVPPDTSYFSIP